MAGSVTDKGAGRPAPEVGGMVAPGFEPVRDTFYVDPDHVIVRHLEAPSGGAVATARAIAVSYGAFLEPGGPLGLRRGTVEALQAPASPARRGYHDECFGGPAKFSLGFMKPSETIDFGSPEAFGAPGAGGSMGFADPTAGFAYGYVTDRMGMELQGA